MGDEDLGSSSRSLDSSNVGFQLLKKCGWKEGTGLGASEQGRLEPLQTHVKNNKRGLGAEKIKQKTKIQEESAHNEQHEHEDLKSKKQKSVSKRIRKMQEQEERMKQQEFQRAFFREFYPDNV